MVLGPPPARARGWGERGRGSVLCGPHSLYHARGEAKRGERKREKSLNAVENDSREVGMLQYNRIPSQGSGGRSAQREMRSKIFRRLRRAAGGSAAAMRAQQQ